MLIARTGEFLASYALNYDGLMLLSSTAVNNYSGGALMTRSYSYLPGAGTNGTTTPVSTYKVKKPTSGNFASYTYDALNQLTGATQNNVTYAYTYDKATAC